MNDMKNTFTHKNLITLLLVVIITIISVYMAGCDTEKQKYDTNSATTSVATADENDVDTEATTQTATQNDTTVAMTTTTSTEVKTEETTTVANKAEVGENTQETHAPNEETVVSQGNAAPGHSHSYTAKVTKATCGSEGYTTYTCKCGASYVGDYTYALKHNWGGWTTVKEATSESEGKRENICNRCGKIKSESIDKIASPYDASCRSDEGLLAERILYYINQYKNVDAAFFYDMKQYADMRSAQLSDNFAHDLDDIREVSNALKYGNCIIEEETIFNWETNQAEKAGNVIEYYDGIPSEAIGKITSCSGSIDEVAYEVATMFYESSGHWKYVGADNTLYIAVGIYFDGPNFYTCLIMG